MSRSIENLKKWRGRMIDLAFHVSLWSKDPSTKVGAVIADDFNRIAGVGYNGFPRGIRDDPDRLNDRPEKYKHVVHAEVNAILNSQRSEGLTLYITLFPCSECAKFVIQAGIKAVVIPASGAPLKDGRWAESHETAVNMFREAGIPVHIVN